VVCEYVGAGLLTEFAAQQDGERRAEREATAGPGAGSAHGSGPLTARLMAHLEEMKKILDAKDPSYAD
jgi:hypothetical protein